MLGLARRAGGAGDPSLRLKSGYAQDDGAVTTRGGTSQGIGARGIPP
jgi:hypothetical protein